MIGVAGHTEKNTCRCDLAAVRDGRIFVARYIELEKHGAGRRNDGCITVAPLARVLNSGGMIMLLAGIVGWFATLS